MNGRKYVYQKKNKTLKNFLNLLITYLRNLLSRNINGRNFIIFFINLIQIMLFGYRKNLIASFRLFYTF